MVFEMVKIGYKDYEYFLKLLVDELFDVFGEDCILACAVFGSVARGEARADSDIDVLVVHKEVGFNPIKRFVDIQFKLEESQEYQRLVGCGLHADVYPVFMSEREIWENPYILLDVLDHGIILYDSGVLRKRLEALSKRLAELGAKKVILGEGRWYWDLKPDWKPGEVIKL